MTGLEELIELIHDGHAERCGRCGGGDECMEEITAQAEELADKIRSGE